MQRARQTENINAIRWKSSCQLNKKPKNNEGSSPTHDRQFNTTWLTDFQWLNYENGAMFCTLCLKHKNKSKYSQGGSKNFLVSNMQDHKASSGHLLSVKMESEIMSKQLSPVQNCITKSTDRIELSACRLIHIAYTVAKTHLPIQKYQDLCELQLCNDTQFTKSLYQDDNVSLFSYAQVI